MNAPSQVQERIVFQHAVEGLFKVLPKLTPRARQRFEAMGIHPEGPWLPAYPLRELDGVIEIAAEELFPGLPRSRALRRLGELQVEGYSSTRLGSALFALLRVLGRRRFLERLTRSWRSANNYIETTIVNVEPDLVHVEVNDVGAYPEVCLGIIAAGLTAAGHAPRSASIHAHQAPGCVYRLDWRNILGT